MANVQIKGTCRHARLGAGIYIAIIGGKAVIVACEDCRG